MGGLHPARDTETIDLFRIFEPGLPTRGGAACPLPSNLVIRHIIGLVQQAGVRTIKEAVSQIVHRLRD